MLRKRMKQHQCDVVKRKPDRSRLAYHAIENCHVFDFANVEVLERERIYRKRMLLEELHIKASNNCVNLKSIESKNVSDIYANLFKKINNI
jgi:hypothetical protein